MSFELTTRVKRILAQRHLRPNLILEVEGIPIKFGAIGINKKALFDDGLCFDDGVNFDSPVADPDGRDWITLNRTTKTMDQQLIPEKAGAGSISSVKIEILNKNSELTKLFQIGNILTDPLNTRARVYLSFDGAEHEEDSVLIFDGSIEEMSFTTTTCVIVVAHAESKTRQDVFQEVTTNTTSSVDSSVTTIPVLSTAGYIPPKENVKSYIVVDEEIIQISDNFDDTNFYDCTRAQLNTVPNSHDSDSDVDAFYRIEENSPIVLALKLYLSSAGNPFFKVGTAVSKINQGSLEFIQNAIFFTEYFDIENQLGLVAGDLIEIEGSAIPSNDGQRNIVSFGDAIDGSYIVVDGPDMTTETAPISSIKFRSQYNVYPEGLGLDPSEVDINGMLEQQELHGANFNPIDIYIKENIEVKELLEKYIYHSQALYTLPRKGRIGVKFVSPPIADQNIVELGPQNIKQLENIQIKRSLNENFYNVIGFQYEEDSLEDEFFVRDVFYAADSTDRFKRTKVLKIDARGFRANPVTKANVALLGKRILDRYKFASQYVENVEVLYKTGFQSEIGDVVLFGEGTKMGDIERGNRVLRPRLMEIVNKKLNFVTGRISFSLLETSFSAQARYGLFSVSSLLSSDSTATELILKTSFNDFAFTHERAKWELFIGERIRIYAPDYCFDEVVTIKAFDEQNQDKLIIDPALSFPVLEDYIMEVPSYDETDQLLEERFKVLYTYMVPQQEVTVSIDSENFEVADPSEFTIGTFIAIHSDDYDRDNEQVEVIDIVGSVITTNDIGFVPLAGDKVEGIDFKDSGFSYKLI